MRLALGVGYWGAGTTPQDQLALVKEADRLGYHSVWVAEAYGSDAVTVMTWLATQTERIGLGSGILQMFARTPAMTAMTASTLDIISGGRVLLGLGLSGPQVVEGWYGQRYDRPLQRTREYIEIVRKILKREALDYQGKVYRMPLPDSEGKALKLITHPIRPDLPIYLAAIGPKNVALAGELCDGWLPAFFSPDFMDEFLPSLAAGAERAGRSIDGIDIVPNATVAIGEDLEQCYAWARPMYALYLGGMGSKKHNFYNALATRYGFGDAAEEVQQLFLEGKRFEAFQAVPGDLIDATSLMGPADRIAERIKRYEAAGVTTLMVHPAGGTNEERFAVLRTLKEIVN